MSAFCFISLLFKLCSVQKGLLQEVFHTLDELLVCLINTNVFYHVTEVVQALLQ